MKSLLRKISLYAAVFVVLIVKTSQQTFASGCACQYVNGAGMTAFCVAPIDITTTNNCNSASPSCSCSPSTTCGNVGQVACVANIPVALATMAEADLRTAIVGIIQNPQLSAWNQALNNSVANIGYDCRTGTPYYNANDPTGTGSRKPVCANSQSEANIYLDALANDINWTSFKLCAQISDGTARSTCEACAAKKGVWTSIGCVDTTEKGIASSAIKLGLGIGGGVVLLMVLAAGFKLTTSKGDPKATQEAQEMITNAVGGLLFIVFSVVLIRTIGKNLLQIPGF